MIHHQATLLSAAASVGLLAGIQVAQAQVVRRDYYVRAGTVPRRADYLRVPQNHSPGYYGYYDYYGDHHRTAYHERRSGHRETYRRTVRRGSHVSTSCRTRRSGQIQRRRIVLRDRDYLVLSDRHDRRTGYYDRRDRDHRGVSFGIWYGTSGRSHGRPDRSSCCGSSGSHGRSHRHAVQHRSQVRSYRGHHYRRTSRRHSIRRGPHRH